jgi:DNA-binding PadR family transcriptional regulator
MRDRAHSPQSRAILQALLEQPLEWRHGYDLAKLVGLSSGTLYPLLIRLHDRGLLEAKWVEPERPGRPARHAYRLSADGLAAAREITQKPEVRPRSSGKALA